MCYSLGLMCWQELHSLPLWVPSSYLSFIYILNVVLSGCVNNLSLNVFMVRTKIHFRTVQIAEHIIKITCKRRVPFSLKKYSCYLVNHVKRDVNVILKYLNTKCCKSGREEASSPTTYKNYFTSFLIFSGCRS